MCGRFAFFSSKEDFVKEFNLNSPPQDLHSNYNFPPQEKSSIIFIRNNEKHIETASWGFVPHWLKQTKWASWPNQQTKMRSWPKNQRGPSKE